VLFSEARDADALVIFRALVAIAATDDELVFRISMANSDLGAVYASST